MNIKNEVLLRVYLVLLVVVVVAVVIFSKAVKISYYEGAHWRGLADSLYVRYKPVKAERGNILADDGSLLATSLPFFEIRFDVNSEAMDSVDFYKNLDSLSYCISTFVDNTYTPGGYKQYLLEKRLAGERYLLLKKDANYNDVEMIKSFPLFRLGKFKGGLIIRKQSKRERPFKMLAQRTIGYIREGAKPVGLEGTFNNILSGDEGQELMQKVGPDTWIPVNDLTEVEPRSGDDIVTTLNVNMQDIVQEALLRSLQYHEADHGVAIIMEVKTGAIKAIANVGRSTEGWWETYNYAIGEPIEPGSTFKLASMLSLLEDGYVDLDDSIDIEEGKIKFYGEEMKDHEDHHIRMTTVRNVFAMSSNVGIAKMVNQYYGEKKRASDFLEHLEDFRLTVPTGIEIDGEATPYFKSPDKPEDNWSGTTLPWMSIGYEELVTPLQLLTFYNAVANNGMMMKPYIVSEVQRFGEVQKRFKPTVVKRKIASSSTIKKAKELLEAVVDYGTASDLKTDKYRFAGKTGTTQLNYERLLAKTHVGGYQASFVGYFPAEDPVYSCLVIINSPKLNGIYGSSVAGPVFREIADKCFSSRPELSLAVNTSGRPVLEGRRLPNFDAGNAKDIKNSLDFLKMDYQENEKADWVMLKADSSVLKVMPRTVKNKVVPSVQGMGLRDALYILENLGLRVSFSGFGKVTKQSILPGTRANGQTIFIALE